MNLIISHDSTKAPRENSSCSISTWSLSLKSHHWAPQRSFPGVTKSVRSLHRNYHTRNQDCFSLFNYSLASYMINWWPHNLWIFLAKNRVAVLVNQKIKLVWPNWFHMLHELLWFWLTPVKKKHKKTYLYNPKCIVLSHTGNEHCGYIFWSLIHPLYLSIGVLSSIAVCMQWLSIVACNDSALLLL